MPMKVWVLLGSLYLKYKEKNVHLQRQFCGVFHWKDAINHTAV